MATTDLARKLRSSILLEDSLVPESEFGLPDLRSKLKEATGLYRARHLAGYALPDMVRANAEGIDPTLKLTSAGQEARYTDPKYTDPKSDSYLGPDTIRALVTQQQQGGRDYLSRVTDKVGRLYDKDTEASRAAVDDVTGELADAEGRYGKRLSRAQALLADEAAAARASVRGGGGGDIGDQLKNPLEAFLRAGGKRIQKADGGFDFVSPSGQKITVEQASSYVPGSTRADLLGGSESTLDQATIKEAAGKSSLTAAAQKDINSINDALNIVDQIDMTSKKINTASGPKARFQGALKFGQGLSGNNADVTRFQQNIGYLSRVVRAMGEVGALNEGDIARASTLIPKITDTAQEAQNKINDLRTILNKNKSAREGGSPTSGIDLSAFEMPQ